jgi:uncharacterized membrane protein YqaE (UPF0057 family)
MIESLITLAIVLSLYLIPSIVAVKRRHCNTTPIILINVVLGWTLAGWFVALVWAFTSNTYPKVITSSSTGYNPQ